MSSSDRDRQRERDSERQRETDRDDNKNSIIVSETLKDIHVAMIYARYMILCGYWMIWSPNVTLARIFNFAMGVAMALLENGIPCDPRHIRLVVVQTICSHQDSPEQRVPVPGPYSSQQAPDTTADTCRRPAHVYISVGRRRDRSSRNGSHGRAVGRVFWRTTEVARTHRDHNQVTRYGE